MPAGAVKALQNELGESGGELHKTINHAQSVFEFELFERCNAK